MIVLGSTGSIGRNALWLAEKFALPVSALSCGGNVALLNEQIAKFQPKFVCIGENADKNALKFDKNRVFVGQDGLEKMLENCEDSLVINAIVGFAGLRPSLKTKALNKTLALANKESLVIAGKFLRGAKIIPIDSEHSALNFLLKNHDKKGISRLIITASGGAFFKLKTKDLKKVTPKMALKHPNWAMGAKITIDSATMVNKLFELVEAYHLFGIRALDALIEPQSLIHALCEFKDGGVSAYFSNADMKLAIAHAILPPTQLKKAQNVVKKLDFVTISKLKFFKIPPKKYPIFALKDAVLADLDLGVVINAANEVKVAQFLRGECEFLDISRGIFKALSHFGSVKISNLDEIFELNERVKIFLKG